MESELTRQVVFADWKRAKIEAQGTALTLSSGHVIILPPPILWPEPQIEPLETNNEYGARLLGQEDWDLFVADGGDWAMLNVIATEQHGVTGPESQASPKS